VDGKEYASAWAPLYRRPQRRSENPQSFNLNAAVTAATVIARLTHGPQIIAPAITNMAKRG
jgi:hypothetical protein